MPRKRIYKVFDKFYVNKDGEPAEHVSARGGIYKVRWSNWKSIKQCQSTDEIRVLIGLFKLNMKRLDKKNDSKMIREWRTAIKMAGDYYHYLKHREDEIGKYPSGWGPLTDTVQDTEKIFDCEQLEEDENEEGSAIGKEDKDPDNFVVSPEQPKRVGSSIDGYIQHGKVVGEVQWYHNFVQKRVQEIYDLEVKNRHEKRKTDPYLLSIYNGWRYDKELKKKGATN